MRLYPQTTVGTRRGVHALGIELMAAPAAGLTCARNQAEDKLEIERRFQIWEPERLGRVRPHGQHLQRVWHLESVYASLISRRRTLKIESEIRIVEKGRECALRSLSTVERPQGQGPDVKVKGRVNVMSSTFLLESAAAAGALLLRTQTTAAVERSQRLVRLPRVCEATLLGNELRDLEIEGTI